jgi:hypothetical protein
MSDRLYEEMGGNRLYECLLKNTDENLDDWKNFENRNDEIDCLFDEDDERTDRDEIDDEDLRSKFVFRKILMMMKMKFSWNKHFNTSSSIHLRRVFSWRVLYRAFSIVIFSSLDTHTSRLRKVSRSRRKRAYETSDLKFFSVHSSKFFRYWFHKSSSMRLSFFHSLIFVSTHFSQSWISFIQLWLRSDFARVMACGIEKCSDCEAVLQEWELVEIVCKDDF